MKTVLVLDGHSAAALAFTRSLGRAGYRVSVGAKKGACAPALASRYCAKSLRYTDPLTTTEKFLNEIADFCEENSVELLIPVTDLTTTIFLHANTAPVKLPPLAAPTKEAYLACSDKFLTYKKSKELRLATPQTWLCNSPSDILIKSLTYPLVVKDRFSLKYVDGELVSGGVGYAFDAQELQGQLDEHLMRFPDVLVQGFSPGVGIGVSLFCDGEKAYSPFMWERLREKDPRGSGSSARRSIPLDDSLLDRCRELLISAGFVGIAMVEFKAAGKVGDAAFMEVNARPWGSMQLANHCGIDYPKILVEWHLFGKKPPERAGYPAGITCRWLKADLLHLENLRQRRKEPWLLPYPSLWASILKVALPWYPGMRYDHLCLDDMNPGIIDLWDWVKQKLSPGCFLQRIGLKR